jgi:hypothetical protein
MSPPWMDGHVGVQLGDHDPILVLAENVRQTHHHNVVVVDQGDADRAAYRCVHPLTLTSLGV